MDATAKPTSPPDRLTIVTCIGCGAMSLPARCAGGCAWPAAMRALAAEPEPIVSWWCDRCGGLDAPAPCIGVCIRRPAQWATLAALQRRREAAAAELRAEQRLARAVRVLALTRPRPGNERRHGEALRELAARTL